MFDNISQAGSSLRSGETLAIDRAITKRSIMEKCCGNKVGPIVLSKMGRVIVLSFYVLAIALAGFGISHLEVYSDQMFFVSKDHELYQYF